MTPILRIAARRQFSTVQSLRAVGRSIESQPSQRLTKTPKSAPANWAGEAKRVGTQFALFVPGIGLLLGWPLLAAKGLDGHV